MQPPVFFDFADIIAENGRVLVENPLILARRSLPGWILKGWSARARDPRTRMIFLCNPHNPVGRVWTQGRAGAAGRHLSPQ